VTTLAGIAFAASFVAFWLLTVTFFVVVSVGAFRNSEFRRLRNWHTFSNAASKAEMYHTANSRNLILIGIVKTYLVTRTGRLHGFTWGLLSLLTFIFGIWSAVQGKRPF
jgi:hypothetical protein